MINAANSSWTPFRVGVLVDLWVTDMTPEAIAKVMGGFDHTADGGRRSVIGKANRMKLPPKRVFADPAERERMAKDRADKRNEVRRQQRMLNYTPDQRALFAERLRARNANKNAKKRQKRREANSASRTSLPPGMSKTAPTYRRRLPAVPEMLTKADMRAFLTQAVLNTQGAEA